MFTPILEKNVNTHDGSNDELDTRLNKSLLSLRLLKLDLEKPFLSSVAAFKVSVKC